MVLVLLVMNFRVSADVNCSIITMYHSNVLFDNNGIRVILCKMMREGGDCVAHMDIRG